MDKELENMNYDEFAELQNEIMEEVDELTTPAESGDVTPEAEPTPEVMDNAPEVQTPVDEPQQSVEDTNENNEETVPSENEPLDAGNSPEVTNTSEDSQTQEIDSTPDEVDNTIQNGNTIPEEYVIAKQFYDELKSKEFVAAGKTLKPFMDVDKIIQMHQMAYGFHKKNEGFNKYRPFLQQLDKAGLTDNPEKFNMLMDIAAGNKEAMLKLAMDNGIELLEEPEKVEYAPQAQLSNETSIVDEVVDNAVALGYGDKMISALQQFDNETLETFVTNPQMRSDIVSHVADGTYDMVESKMQELAMFDKSGSFNMLPYGQRYLQAYNILAQELVQQREVQPPVQQQVPEQQIDPQVVEQRKIEMQLKEQEERYKAELAAKQKELDEQRKKAAMLSGQRQTIPTTTTNQEMDPTKLAPGDFMNFIDDVLTGNKQL